MDSLETNEINLVLRQEADVGSRCASNLCIVCFDEVDPKESACKLSLCKHVICDSCLSMHIKVRLDEGDVAGVVCPEPNCRLPISEAWLSLGLG